MNEEEFLKEHPSSEGLIYKPTGIVYNRNEPIMTIEDIHKTQLDKQKVKEIMYELESKMLLEFKKIPKEMHTYWNRFLSAAQVVIKELKKELGI